MKKEVIKMYRFRLTSLLLCVSILSVTLSGCSLKRDINGKESEIPATETQAETETREIPASEIQSMILQGNRTGNISYQLMDESGTHDGVFSFEVSEDAFHAYDEGREIYSDSSGTFYYDESQWKSEEGSFYDIWDLVSSSNCVSSGRTKIGEKECYHLSLEDARENTCFYAICALNGYLKTKSNGLQYDFYIGVDTGEIERVDVTMPFTAIKGKEDITGELSASLTTLEISQAISVERPEIQIDMGSEDITGYGIINGEENLYQNESFNIQILGKDLFVLDEKKTQELKKKYEAIQSPYMEEAYGMGDGIIVSIVTTLCKKNEKAASVIKEYLGGCKAEQVEKADKIKCGDTEYACYTSRINQTNTKTYGTVKDGKALVITIYYSEESILSDFEKEMYGMDEDPAWEPTEWILNKEYSVITPKGYSIVEKDSGELYVCMESSEGEVNVFALEETALDDELSGQTVSAGDVIREQLSKTEVPIGNDTSMLYLSIHNTEGNYEYYTYIGLIQMENDLIEIYAVSAEADRDYTEEFTGIAENISKINK